MAAARASKFTEGAMTPTEPSADQLWPDLGIEDTIRSANGLAPVPAREANAAASQTSSTPAHPNEGIFGRFGRAATSFWRNATFSTIGKRKERDSEKKEETRKEQYEKAYAEMKAQGAFSTPRVFIRPRTKHGVAGRSPSTLQFYRKRFTDSFKGSGEVASAISTPIHFNAPTPALRASTSKKDLQKQAKLSRQVSDLEFKLAQARKKLSDVLGENAPPVPPVPALRGFPSLPPTPNTITSTSNFFDPSETSPHTHAEAITPRPSKTLKKRKGRDGSDDEDNQRRDPTYKPTPTDSEHESDYTSSPHGTKRTKSVQQQDTTTITPHPFKALAAKASSRSLRKSSGPSGGKRLKKKRSTTTTTKEEVVIVVPDGVAVPPIPSIPHGMEGKRAAVSTSPSKHSDDGFGGLGHEIF